MITKKEIIELLKGINEDSEIVIIAKNNTCDEIERMFIDSESGNAVLTVGRK